MRSTGLGPGRDHHAIAGGSNYMYFNADPLQSFLPEVAKAREASDSISLGRKPQDQNQKSD